MEIPILLLDFNQTTHSSSSSTLTLETLGNVACYKRFLMKESIKLLSLFDDDSESGSQIRPLKPHVIVGPTSKGSSTFQLFQAGSYTSASMLATLMKICDPSLPSNSGSNYSSSSNSNKGAPPTAAAAAEITSISVLDYIIEGLKLGREVYAHLSVLYIYTTYIYLCS